MSNKYDPAKCIAQQGAFARVRPGSGFHSLSSPPTKASTMSNNQDLIAALRELVRLKDVKKRIESFRSSEYLSLPETDERDELLDDYTSSKESAWAAARHALAALPADAVVCSRALIEDAINAIDEGRGHLGDYLFEKYKHPEIIVELSLAAQSGQREGQS